jgi:hypothetical protein
MIVVSVLHFIRTVWVETLRLREQTLQKHPYLRGE